MSGWDYAELSKMAKSYGGPEKMLEAIKKASEVKGGLITLGILGLTVGGIYIGKKYVIPMVKALFKSSKDAEKQIIQGIKEYDASMNSEKEMMEK